MRKLAWILAVVVALVGGAVAVAWQQAWLLSPWTARYAELAAQLRDRGAVAVAGRVPLGLNAGDTALVPVGRYPALATSLSGTDPARTAEALGRSRADGLLVRVDGPHDHPLGAPGTVLRSLTDLRAVRGLGAVYLDETAALYETAERVELSPADARQLIAVTRLILGGATAPPERLFPEAIRRTRPVEVALIVRDGHEPILWRSTRAGSIARALLDVSFAVLDRWSTRQQERYGRLHDALATKTLTLAVFYDKGVLGARSVAFLRRAVDTRVYAVGYERLANWEYALPPTPWAPGGDPVAELNELLRDRGVPSPGYLRPELTLYRFRALQMIEQTPGGAVEIYDP